MRRLWLALLSLLAVAGLTTSLAFASSPHFKGVGPTFTDHGTTLTASGVLAGLGNGDVKITLMTTGTPAVACTNPGGNAVPGQDPAQLIGLGELPPISADKIKNGAVLFSVTTTPPAVPGWDVAGCPSATWAATITDMTFTGANIVVEQGGQVVLSQTFTP